MAETSKELKKKKRWIIAVSLLVGIIAIIITLSFTLFALKEVKIDFRTSHNLITLTDEEIIESGQFKMGSSVFFHGKNGYIQNIENASPYIKVVNIETQFPSTFVVHISQRQEVYALSFEGGHYICDEEFRILRIEDNFISSQANAIEVDLDELNINGKIVGEYLPIEIMPNIYGMLFENNRPLNEQIAMIESVKVYSEYDSVVKKSQITSELKFYSGQTFKIINCGYGLKYKVKMMIDVFSQIYDFIGKDIKLPDGSTATLTEENLKTCTILITNYYDYTRYGESDCYFNILLLNNN